MSAKIVHLMAYEDPTASDLAELLEGVVLMPNWCSNGLRVIGPGSEAFIERAAKVSDDESRHTLFQEFHPMPQALEGRTWSSLEGEYFMRVPSSEAGSDTWWLPPEEQERWRLTEEMKDANYEKYGAKDWYDWHVKYWGTKWDTSAQFIEPNLFLFSTAWSPPIPWLETVSKDFPEAEFWLAYVERGMEFYGEVLVHNGTVDQVASDGGPFYSSTPDWDALDTIYEKKGLEAYEKAEREYLVPRLKTLLDEYQITSLGG